MKQLRLICWLMLFFPAQFSFGQEEKQKSVKKQDTDKRAITKKEAAKKEAVKKADADKAAAAMALKNAAIKKAAAKKAAAEEEAVKKEAAVRAVRKLGARRAPTKQEKADDHDHDHDHKKGSKSTTPKKNPYAGSFNPLETKGALDDISVPLKKILKMKRKNGRLRFDLPSSYQEADASFREIRTKSRGGGGGHGSGVFWTQYFTGQNMGGRIQKSDQYYGGNQKRNPDSFVVEMIESTGRGRDLQVYGNNAEDFLLRIDGGLDPYHLQVVQNKNELSIQEYSQGEAFSGTGANFEEFCKRHPDFVQDRLIPILSKYGIGAPVTRFNSVTRDHVLGLLNPVDSKKLLEFKKVFSNLESSKYDERESATEKLKKEFKDWSDIVRSAAGDESFSIEVRSRLQKIMKDLSSEEDRQLIALVTANDLKNDIEYLVWLLEQSGESEQKPHIIAQLKRVTGEDLGEEVTAWKAFVQKSNTTSLTTTKVDTAEVGTELAKAEGYLPQMAKPTSNLLRLTLKDGKMLLDRKFWSDQFGGKSIKELVTNIQTQVEKSNLPKRWFSSGGHSLDTVRHEHVLFEHIQSVVPSQLISNSYSYGNLSSYRRSQINRTIEQPHLFIKFELEPVKAVDGFGGRSSTNKVPKIFRYSVRERNYSHMFFSFVETNDQQIHAVISNRKSKSMFTLHQGKDGAIRCSIHQGNQSQSVSAASFKQLLEKDPEFLKSKVWPIFQRFGIQISKEMGGELEIKNAPAPKRKT